MNSGDPVWLLGWLEMLPCTDTDERLIQRIVNHEGSALIELRRRYHRVVMATGVRILHDRADAEDVAQDVMTRVWCRAHSYESRRGPPLTWVIQITRNRAVDVLRCKSRWRRVQQHVEVAAGSSDAETRMTVEREADAVRAALLLLPTTQRELVEHAFFKELSHTELAASFRLPLGTVKSRIRLGLVALKRHLAFPVKTARPGCRL